MDRTQGAGSDLLARVAVGDEVAFAALYDQFAPAVFGLVRRMVGDLAHAQAVAEDVFVWAWLEAARCDSPDGSARVWLMTLAHRLAVECVHAVRDPDPGSAHDPGAADRDWRQVAEETVVHLRGAPVLDGWKVLTPPQRSAIALVYFGSRTYREVADLLDACPAAITTRIRDGMGLLRRRLQSWSSPAP